MPYAQCHNGTRIARIEVRVAAITPIVFAHYLDMSTRDCYLFARLKGMLQALRLKRILRGSCKESLQNRY